LGPEIYPVKLIKIELLLFLIIVLVVSAAVSPVLADNDQGKTLVIHAKTSLEVDSAQLSTVPNVVWTGLSEGYRVVILFDASGITAIKKNRELFGIDITPLDEVDLPQQERDALADQFNVPLTEVPANYGEYIRFLKEKKGVDLYVNRIMMLHFNINSTEIDPAVIPITLTDMVKLINNATVYIAY